MRRSTQSHRQYNRLHQAASFLQPQLRALLKTSILGSLTLVFGWVAPGSTIPVNSTATAKVVTPVQPDAATKARVLETYGKLPLSFEANQGQTDKQVNFLTRGNGYSVFLTPTEAVLTQRQTPSQSATAKRQSVVKPQSIAKSKTSVLRLQLVGSNPTSQVKGLQQLPGTSNYLMGKNSSKWYTGIANYAQVQYQAVYPGIDLMYYGNQRQLEYDFAIAPGANPQNIRFHVKGASRLAVDQQGNLLLHTPGGLVRQHRPIIYQEINGQKKAIAGGYVLLGKQQVGFKVAAYDQTQRLVIDPVISYSTYLGGSIGEGGTGIAVDLQGNVYVAGTTGSTDFPTMNASNGTPGGFVTKINPNVSGAASLVYSTFLRNGQPESIAVDVQGDAYVTGITYSTDFPTTGNAFSTTLGGFADAFVTELNATGNLVYSTYLGGSSPGVSGSSADFGNGIAVDLQGNVYVAGETYTADFPTKNAFNNKLNGYNDAFVAKLNPSASGTSSLIYSSYLGGSGFDTSSGIAVDSRGNAYVTGLTYSTDFPTLNAFDSTLGGSSDAFVTKVNPSASGAASLVYSSYLGGSRAEFGRAIAVDYRGNAYVTGETSSADFPTKNALNSTFGGGQDAFVTKVNPSASGADSLVYSTYLGGSSGDNGFGIAVDLRGNAYVTGSTNSNDFPLKNAFDSSLGGNNYYDDAFVTKLNATGNSLLYSSYLGGNSFDNVEAIAVDARGNAYVTGSTSSTDFPTQNAFDSSLTGSSDAFVTKIRD